MKVTLIKGDGIGPEICDSMKKILKALGSKVEFEEVNAGASVFEKENTFIPDRVFKSIEKNKIAIKGPITTPIGHGFRSINVELRKKYDLFANIRPIKSIKNIKTKYENVDMVIFVYGSWRKNFWGRISFNKGHYTKKIWKNYKSCLWICPKI